MKVAAARTGGRGRTRSPSVCGACFIHTDTVSYVQASNDST